MPLTQSMRKVRPAYHPSDLSADRTRALALTPVSRETEERLDRFVALLLDWQKTTNLIAPSTIPELWTRHIADSLQIVPLAPVARTWADFGSGAGFPGLMVACALADRPDTTVHLVESNTKKAAFLREAVRVTGAPAVVHAMRIEEFVARPPAGIEIVTSRALAALALLLAHAHPLLRNGGEALFLKGQDVELELTEAAKYWSIQATFVQSKTDPQGRVVVVRGLSPRADK